MTAEPRVAVLIPSWDGRAHLEVCLEALADQEDPGLPWEIWVHDNGSRDGTFEWLADRHPEVRCRRSSHNRGFAEAINQLVDAAGACDFVVFLNNDTRPDPGWLRALVGSLREAPAEVAAVSGLIVDWSGERLDFGRGIVTFDGHAFQPGYGRPLDRVTLPASGEELPFACGGNMIVRRSALLEVGGLDAAYFAYYEDVDLGWRLWARGYRILFSAEARIHHHSSATSDLLGMYHRGYLFERNAFLTAYKNLDEEFLRRLLPAILWTLMHRTQTLLIERNPGGAELMVDPYAGLIGGTAGEPGQLDETAPGGGSIRQWLRRLRLGLARRIAGRSAHVELTCDQTLAQLRAVSNLLGSLDQVADRRQRVQALRRRPDRDYLNRFPLYVVPTYPGDERLFASAGFRRWIEPETGPPLPLVEAELGDLIEP